MLFSKKLLITYIYIKRMGIYNCSFFKKLKQKPQEELAAISQKRGSITQ